MTRLLEWYFNEEYQLERESARQFKVTIQDMYDEEDWFRVEAHTPPETSQNAWRVFTAIHSNAEEASVYLSGAMGISYLCLDKIKLIKLAKLNGIDLRRYGHFIDLYDNKLKEINRRKSDGK